MTLGFPLTLGDIPDFTSVEANFGGGIKFGGLMELNYSRKRNRKYEYGPHPDPVGVTTGQNQYAGDCSLLLIDWRTFLLTSGPGYGDRKFVVVANYSLPDFTVMTDLLLGCSINTTEASQKAGPDGLVRKVELSPVKILFGGFDDAAISLALASL
jgi:hypothetical protein